MNRMACLFLWLFCCGGILSAQETPDLAATLLRQIDQKQWAAAEPLAASLPVPVTPEYRADLLQALNRSTPGADALPLLQTLSQKFPTDPEIIFLHSSIYERIGNATEAIRLSADAIALATGDLDLFYRAALLAESVNQLDEAEKRLQRILARNPYHVDSLFGLGRIALSREDDLIARYFFQQVIDLDPNHYPTRYELGVMENRVGNFAEAERHLRMANQAYPFFREAYHALLLSLAKQRKRDEIREFQAIVNKMNMWSREKLKRLHRAYQDPASLSPEDAYEYAASLFQVDRHNLARAFLEKQLLSGNVIEPELYLLAQLRYRAKDYKGCLELLEKVHYETATQSVTFAALKAWSLYFLNRFEETRDYAAQVQEKHGQSSYFTSLKVALDQIFAASGVMAATGTIPILSPFHFADSAEKSGLAAFQHTQGNPEKHWITDAMGSGVAVADYDKDGDDDVYMVNSRPDLNNADPNFKNALFRNDNGVYVNVTDTAGVGDVGCGMSAAWGDVNNDGWPDLYVGNFGRNTLYLSNGNGTFADYTEPSKTGDPGWTTTVSFGDVDKDGDLDLFVGNYVEFVPAQHATARGLFRGLTVFADALSFTPQRNHLYLNNGAGVFEDASPQSWINMAPVRTLGSALFDLDNDGDLDLYTANDSTYNYVLSNRGNGRFDDISFISGGAITESHIEGGSTGVIAGDYNNDGFLDLFVTSPEDTSDTLLKNEGNQALTDFSRSLGFAGATAPLITWGSAFGDFDSDGLLDLFTANGHVYPQVDSLHNGHIYAQGVTFYRNDGSRFENVTDAMQWENFTPRSSRGVALLDFDNDGDLDVLVNCIDSKPQLLENRTPQGHWLQVVLDAPSAFTYGVRVVARKGTQTWTRFVDGGSGYLSQSSAKLHFGFGAIDAIDELVVHWMHRAAQSIPSPLLNSKVVVPLPAQ